MAKSLGRNSNNLKQSENFRSARAAVWRELGSIREAAKTGVITRVTNTFARSDSGRFSETHKKRK
jgi:hypothetical protein